MRQTLTDWEIVITDDGSTDGSQRLITQLARKDRRIKPHFFPRNQGAMAAVNNAYSRLNGQYLFCHGVDDFIIDETFLARSLQALEAHESAAGFFGRAVLFSNETNSPCGVIGCSPEQGFVQPARFLASFLRNEVFVPGSGVVWRKELLDAIGGFDFSLGPQIDFFINHALPALHGIVYDEKPVTCQRVYARESNFGSKDNLWEMAARYAKMEEKFKELIPFSRELEAEWRGWRTHWMQDSIRKVSAKVA